MCAGNTRANKAWKILKGMRNNNRDTAGINLIKMTEWVDYYKNLLTEDRAEFAQSLSQTYLPPMINNETPITIEEVKNALKYMKNKKSPGPGGINIELLKAAPDMLTEILVAIFNKCLEGEDPPDEWKTAIISSIYKKGGRQNCKNYRGISVTSSVARLYGRVLKGRIEEQFTEEEEQNGFRVGRSCIDGIFTLKNLIEKRIVRGRAVHLVFVDLQKAYDTVPLSKLWPSMEKIGISEAYIYAIQKLYSDCRSSINIGGKLSQEFYVTKGLRQGCSLAPVLFKIYIQDVLTKWKQKCRGMGIPIHDETLYTLLFADDQVLVAGDQDDASYMLRKLMEEFSNFGLTINMEKTEYMAVGEQQPTELNIGTSSIKNCSCFKYLGVTLSSNGKSSEDIQNKIGQGKRVIRQLNSLLWSNKLTKRTKSLIYGSIFESICTYGSETWEMTERDKNRMMALEMDFWRRSSRVSKLEHVRNDTVRQIMNVENTILDTIEGKRLTWFGHLQRMEDNRWPKKVWNWVPPERRKRGRPPRMWMKDVEEAMINRGLREGDWWNRRLWNSRSGKRHQL